MDWTAELGSYYDLCASIGAQCREPPQGAACACAFPHATWAALGRTGLFEVATRPCHGFRGGIVRLAAALEGLAAARLDDDGLPAAIVGQCLVLSAIDHFAVEEVRTEYLLRLRRGDELACVAPGRKVAPSGARLRVRPDGCAFLSCAQGSLALAPHASVAVVFAHDAEAGQPAAVLLETSPRAMDIGPVSVCVAGWPHGATLDEAEIPARQILASGTAAAKILHAAVSARQVLAPFIHIGRLRRFVEAVMLRATEPGAALPQAAREIAHLRSGLDTLCSLAHGTLARFAAGKDVSLESALVEAYAARTSNEVAQQAERVEGYGALDALPSVLGRSSGASVSPM